MLSKRLDMIHTNYRKKQRKLSLEIFYYDYDGDDNDSKR